MKYKWRVFSLCTLAILVLASACQELSESEKEKEEL